MLTRRSIRQFKEEQITDEELSSVIEAGKYAPTAGNQQSEIFVVIQNKDAMKKIDTMNAAIIGKDIHPFYGAPTVILVLADKSKAAPVEDASLALGNMFNAAASLGLGTCWIHRIRQMFETGEGKELLREWGVEGDYVGVGACAIGYPNCPLPEAAPRKENFVYYVK